jgi:hypothetical protein
MRFRTSLLRLLVSTMFIAVGLALCIPVTNSLTSLWRETWNSLLIVLAGFSSLSGGTALGAGILMPFRNSWLGAVLGFSAAAIGISMLVVKYLNEALWS